MDLYSGGICMIDNNCAYCVEGDVNSKLVRYICLKNKVIEEEL